MKEIKANEVRSMCLMCTMQHPVICEVNFGKFTGIRQDTDSPYSGPLCEKGLAAPELVYHPDRLNYPLKRTKPKTDRDGGWVRISWDEAYDTIVKRINEVKEKYGAESILHMSGGQGGGNYLDDIFWCHRFANCIGTPNRSETGIASCELGRDGISCFTFGSSIQLTVDEEKGIYFFGLHAAPDFENSACIMVWGYNPRETENSHYYRIINAKKRGAKLIVVDPRRTELAENADIHMAVRPGSDGCIAMSMINVMLNKGLYDKTFVRDWTNGPFLVRTDSGDLLTERDLYPEGNPRKYIVWDEASKHPTTYNPETVSFESSDIFPALLGAYKVNLADGKEVECKTCLQLLAERAAKYPPKKAEELTWVPAEAIEQAAIWVSTLKRSCWMQWTGLEQNTNQSQTNRAVHVMHLLTGNFDLPGGNIIYPFPPPLLGDYEGLMDLLPIEQQLKRIGHAERPLGVGTRGYILHYDAWDYILKDKIKAAMGFAANHLCVGTDAVMGRKALQQLEFMFMVEIFMTPTAELADIVLPAACVWESPNVVGFSHLMGFTNILGNYLKWREPVVPPLFERKPDLQILCELADRFGFGDKFCYGDVDACLNLKIAPSGCTVEQLRNSPTGDLFVRSIVPRFAKYAERDPETGNYRGVLSPTKKMEIYSTYFRKHGYEPLPEFVEPKVSPISQPKLAEKYPLYLINARTRYMTQSQYAGLPSIRKKIPDPYFEIHPETAKKYGIEDGDWVYIETKDGKIKEQAKVTDKIIPNVVCCTFGWWQGCPQLGIPPLDPFGPEGANLAIVVNAYEDNDPVTGSLPIHGYMCSIKKAETAGSAAR